MESLVEPASSAAPATPAEKALEAGEKAAVDAAVAKEKALESLSSMQSTAGGFLAQAFNGAGNMQRAAAAALAEANAKAAAEREATAPKAPTFNPLAFFGDSVEDLYKKLDAAIERDDLEAARDIKEKIDKMKS